MNIDIKKQLFDAVKIENVALINELATMYPGVLHEYLVNQSFLHFAARDNLVTAAKTLIKLGIDVNIPNNYDDPDTPLGIAATRGAISVAKLLLENGADVNGIGTCPPLISAIIAGNLEMVKLLVEYGANTNYIFKNYEKPLTPVQVAEAWGKTEIAEYLKSVVLMAESVPSKPDDFVTWHIEKVFGAYGKVGMLAMHSLNGNVRVIVVTPKSEQEPLVLITDGMSKKAMNVPAEAEGYQYAELVIQLPNYWSLKLGKENDDEYRWPIEWLLRLAEMPFQQNRWFTSNPTVVEVGSLIAPKIPFTGFLIAEEPADWGTLKKITGETVRFMTVFPLYQSEIDFEKKEGLEMLYNKFMQAGISTIADPTRKNSVT